MPRKHESRDPHGWNSLENFLHVQVRRLRDAQDDGFVLETILESHWIRDNRLAREGRIRCQGGLFIDVQEFLEVRKLRSRDQVRTSAYSYHAGIEGALNRLIFRYDNFHVYAREGHFDAHHKHRFEPRTWREIDPPEWIGAAGRPHLSVVLVELRHWWKSTGQHLNLAESGR